MEKSYREFVGRSYHPPHGCFSLVRQVYEEKYGIILGKQDEGLDPFNVDKRTARLHEKLAALGEQVEEPKEGDVILIRSFPYHIGVVIDAEKGQMLHNYSGGTSCVESYRMGRWKNRIEGFWRYNGEGVQA